MKKDVGERVDLKNESEKNISNASISNKQKILIAAADLFALKGYTETSIREIASAVGIKGSSIYNHFISKNNILEYMLEDYAAKNAGVFSDRQAIYSKLKESPTVESILCCMQLSFSDDKKEYYLKILNVILQEQHRNPTVREFVSKNIILRSSENTKTIINILKELNIIRKDTDPDFWMKISSSLFYTFATRMMLGIGDNQPDFTGMNMMNTLKHMYELMFKVCGIENK